VGGRGERKGEQRKNESKRRMERGVKENRNSQATETSLQLDTWRWGQTRVQKKKKKTRHVVCDMLPKKTGEKKKKPPKTMKRSKSIKKLGKKTTMQT